MNAHQWATRHHELATKFWALVDKRGPDECWPWLGNRTSGGYGYMTHRYVKYSATDVAFALKTGAPLVHMGCHECDNPWCANPKHIFDGTAQMNADDRDAKGRGPFQRVNRQAVLRLHAEGRSGKDIARRAGCSQPMVSKILKAAGLGRQKISSEIIEEWIKRRKRGMSCGEIALEYGVKRTQVSKHTKDALKPYGRQ